MNDGAVELRIGELLRRTWRIYRDNALLIVGIAVFIFWLPPELILRAIALPNKVQSINLQNGVSTPFVFIASTLWTALGLAAQSGQRPSFGMLVRAIGDRWIAFLGATIFSNALTIVGLLALIVPGLIALVALSLSGPACIAERLSPADALSRSRQLTQGHRLKIFGSILVLLAALFFIVFIATLTAVIAVNAFPVTDDMTADKLYTLLIGLAAALVIPAFYIFGTVLYWQLAGRATNTHGQTVAEVFE